MKGMVSTALMGKRFREVKSQGDIHQLAEPDLDADHPFLTL